MFGLGPSWKTSLVGYVTLLLTVANQVFAEQGFPDTAQKWFVFVGGIVAGIGFAIAKDGNVSNSPVPVAAQVVSPDNEVKANPATKG